MKNRFTIATLGELLAVALDAQAGFDTCAERAAGLPLRLMFTSSAQRCSSAAAELRNLIALLGGDPAIRGRVLCAGRRGWAQLRNIIGAAGAVLDPAALDEERSLEDDRLLEACERTEDHTLEVYRNALDEHLPDFVRDVVQRQFEAVMADQLAMREHRPLPLTAAMAVASRGAELCQ